MDYIIFLILVVVFFLGTSKTRELATFLKDPEQRRNLAFRVAGFAAMSLWVHALPSILLTIYMREHGILAPELFTADAARAVVVGVYLAPFVLLAALALSTGALVAWAEGSQLRFWSRESVFGYALFAAIIVATAYRGWVLAIVLFVVVVVLAVYITFSLHAPIEAQVRYFGMPFLAIGIVSYAMFTFSSAIENLVGDELRRFSIGGGKEAFVIHGGQSVRGSLILLTAETVYIQVPNGVVLRAGTPQRIPQCVLRIPAKGATVATTDFLPTQGTHRHTLQAASWRACGAPEAVLELDAPSPASVASAAASVSLPFATTASEPVQAASAGSAVSGQAR